MSRSGMTDEFGSINIQEELQKPENQLVGRETGDETRKRMEDLIELTEEILPTVGPRKRKYFQIKFNCWKADGGKLLLVLCFLKYIITRVEIYRFSPYHMCHRMRLCLVEVL